jgi:hypothetical protein
MSVDKHLPFIPPARILLSEHPTQVLFTCHSTTKRLVIDDLKVSVEA